MNKIVMVGPFPPPLHGMSAVNVEVLKRLQAVGADPMVIDIAASNLDRSLLMRLRRLPRIIRGLFQLALTHDLRGGVLYMSVSGGFGQFSEILFLLVARARSMRVFLHHHSFAYLESPNGLTHCLVSLAGPNAVHVALSADMSEKLRLFYRARHVILVSNAVFFLPPVGENSTRSRQKLRVLGFLSNISQEKGVFDFLDLMAEIQSRGLPLRGKLAGPFVDARTELMVRDRLGHLQVTDYVGPKYGREKEAFYECIDTLVFPTRYVHEAESLVIHEAMMRALPVITYGRGAIPEMVTPDCGRVVPPDEPFVPAALAQIESWCSDPSSFQAASRAAAERFTRTHMMAAQRCDKLLHAILHDEDAVTTKASQSSGLT